MLKTPSTFEVPRVHSPTREEFEARFLVPRRPVVITGVVDRWPAFAKWTDQHLKKAAGFRTVRVSSAHDGAHFAFGGKERLIDYSPMKLGDFVDVIMAGGNTDGQRYVHNVPLEKGIPELWRDISYPPYFDAERIASANFWFGGGNNYTPLHYDASNNFLAQVRGIKQVLLCPPEEIVHLYPFSVTYACHHFSRVNVEEPDLHEFPDYARAERSLVELRAGEMLFIPFFWWHGVYSLQRNIALNFWWSPKQSEYLRHPRQAARAAGRRGYLEYRSAIGKPERAARM